jgi:signal peptidase I
VKDPYAVLGVPRDASDAQIRYAYRQAMRRQGDAGEGAVSTEEQEDVRWAYEVLSDPRKRRAFDGRPPEGRDRQFVSEGTAARPVLSEAEKVPRNPITRATHRLPRPYRVALDWFVTIAGAIAIVLAIKAWVVNPYRIPSSSMEPTLHCARGPNPTNSGCEARFSDRVLANRFIYHLRKPHRGEIVVFNTPPKAKLECGAGGTFVKRLIGLPGEKIRERDGFFFVNGKRLGDRGYIKPERRDTRSGFWIVPPHSYFFVGDNRTQSCDSRRWGSVPRGNLIGPVFAIYWPPNRIHINTPGPVGAAVLAVIGGIVVVLIAVGVRRRHVR